MVEYVVQERSTKGLWFDWQDNLKDIFVARDTRADAVRLTGLNVSQFRIITRETIEKVVG